MARFQPGNPGGPGRPKRPVEEKYLKKLSTAVTLNDWKAIVQKAVEQAKDGDDKARAWLSDHLIGKPTQRVEHSGDMTIGLIWDLPVPSESQN
jgi:hypothetical protein